MTSRTGKPYSTDLRWRAVWLHVFKEMTFEEVGDLLFMSSRSVRRYVNAFYTSGNVDPAQHRHGPLPILNQFEQLTVLQSLLDDPSMFLDELQQELANITGTLVHISTICRTIHRLGMTRQKLRHIALQQSLDQRALFMLDISMFDPEMIVWLDETGSDRRDGVRAYGYGLRGLTPVKHQLKVWGKRISAIGVMTMEGIEDVFVYEGSVNGDVFEYFVRTTLLPLLMPYDGQNKHSVVVMDNASIHHLETVQDMILGVGALIRFLPPYSPDLNPKSY